MDAAERQALEVVGEKKHRLKPVPHVEPKARRRREVYTARRRLVEM